MIAAEDLVGAVRGRRLCYEVAQRGPAGGEIRRAMFDEVHRVHEERGDYARGDVVIFWASSGGGAASTSTTGPPPPADRTLTEAMAAPDATMPSPTDLLAALADTVTSAMGWQPPHAEDVVLARDELRAALLPIAEAILRAPGTAWWSLPLDRAAQVDTRFVDPRPDVSTAGTTPSGTPGERLLRWRDGVVAHERTVARYRAEHRGERFGGNWWVIPSGAGLDKTTRSLPDAGSASLWLTEDEFDWVSADLFPSTIDSAARVLEIAGPSDWARLVESYPLDVTGSRAPDWYEALPARDGRWLLPDWSAVARDHDGVHVTVLAWLTTSGAAVPAGPGASTTLAGWDPYATWWLTDATTPADTGDRWVRDQDGWARP